MYKNYDFNKNSLKVNDEKVPFYINLICFFGRIPILGKVFTKIFSLIWVICTIVRALFLTKESFEEKKT